MFGSVNAVSMPKATVLSVNDLIEVQNVTNDHRKKDSGIM